LKQLSQQQQDDILKYVLPCMEDARSYYTSHLLPDYLERANVIDSKPEYYNNKFKRLNKIPLTTSEVSDTIGWMIAPVVDIFTNDDYLSVKGQNGSDDDRAKKVKDLLNYQQFRQNDGFLITYHWLLSMLQYNIGFKKKTWVKEEEQQPGFAVLDEQQLMALKNKEKIALDDRELDGAKVKIKKEVLTSQGDGMTMLSLYDVDYEETITTKSQPLDEILPVTEVRWASDTKRLKDASFVEHVKTVTLNDLYEKERQGIYFNIDMVKEMVGKPVTDQLTQQLKGYKKDPHYNSDDLRRPIEIHECYVQYDMNKKKKLEPWIFHVAGNILIGAQPNTMGRNHPILDLVGMPDAFNVVPRKGIVELLAEIQHISTALVRLMIKHLIVSNGGRRFVNKNLVDQDDVANEVEDVGVDGDPRQAVFPMPIAQQSPATMPFMQYLQDKTRRTIGVSEYNTGGNSAALNDTATGVTALIDQSNKKINLLAKICAHYFVEDLRFQIALNQQYIDEKQVIRLLDEPIEVDPADLEGKIDLIVNAGIGTTNKQIELQQMQLLMGVLEKIGASYPEMVTPDKVYNVVRDILAAMGKKNVDEYVNNPEFVQQLQQMQEQMMMMQQKIAMYEGGMNGGNTGTESQTPTGVNPAVQPSTASGGIPIQPPAGPAPGMF
jgi:hypothetical protein